MNLETPVDADDFHQLVDWLELCSVLSEENIAHFDLVVNALEIGAEYEFEDFGDQDQKREEIAIGLAEEIKIRTNALGDAYPFQIYENGEVLRFIYNENYGHLSYVISLLINHSWRKGSLLPPSKLTDEELRNGRNIFEIISTIAAVGMTHGGPAFLLGTNRAGAAGLLARIHELCEIVGEGSARQAPHQAAPENANDDKVDLVAVELERDGPPHRRFVFGQSAAGADFKNKSIKSEVSRFLRIWFDDPPANTEAAIFIPAILDETERIYQTERLGHLMHRLRLPHYAAQGAQIVENEQNQNLVHYIEDINQPREWLNNYMDRVRRGEA